MLARWGRGDKKYLELRNPLPFGKKRDMAKWVDNEGTSFCLRVRLNMQGMGGGGHRRDTPSRRGTDYENSGYIR